MILPEIYKVQDERLALMPFKRQGSSGVHIDQIPYSVSGIDFYGCDEEISCFAASYHHVYDKYEHDQLIKQELQCNDYGKYEYYFSAGALAILCSIYDMNIPTEETVTAYTRLYPECVHKFYNFMLKHKPDSSIKLSIDGVDFQMQLVFQWENPVEPYTCVGSDCRLYVPSSETFKCINTSVVLWEQATPTKNQECMLCMNPIYNTRRYAVMLLGELYEMAENKSKKGRN